MSANEIHVGDVGTVFEVILKDDEDVVDISQATVKQIHFRKPDASTLEKPGTFNDDGTDGMMYYTSVEGDLNLAGKWQIQAYVVLPVSTPAGTWSSDLGRFEVFPNIKT